MNKIFFSKISGIYDPFFGKWIKKMQGKVIRIAGVKNNSKILDAGCGTGNLLRYLEDYKKKLNLYGIDISKEMLEIAREKLEKSKLYLQSAEKLKFEDNFFNYIFSTDAFHHYYNPDKVMKNFYRILKKNGKLLVADFNFGGFFNKLFHMIEPGNNQTYSPLEFRKLFKKHGFREIKQRKVGLFTVVTIGKK